MSTVTKEIKSNFGSIKNCWRVVTFWDVICCFVSWKWFFSLFALDQCFVVSAESPKLPVLTFAVVTIAGKHAGKNPVPMFAEWIMRFKSAMHSTASKWLRNFVRVSHHRIDEKLLTIHFPLTRTKMSKNFNHYPMGSLTNMKTRTRMTVYHVYPVTRLRLRLRVTVDEE